MKKHKKNERSYGKVGTEKGSRSVSLRFSQLTAALHFGSIRGCTTAHLLQPFFFFIFVNLVPQYLLC